VILTTGYASVESAVEALRLGATDYLVKPINVTRLQTVLKRIATTSELRAEVHSLRGELRRYGRFGRLLGSSEPCRPSTTSSARLARPRPPCC
jgi:DNA-binding NtrC family response regulator